MEYPQVRRNCEMCGKEYWHSIGGFFDKVTLCGKCLGQILIDTAQGEWDYQPSREDINKERRENEEKI